MSLESDDLKSFVADLKADRAAQKEKEMREAWTKYTSLSIVITAVLAAIATQWGGKYSSRTLASLNDSTFNQTQASDQWSFFQAKSIKQNLYEIERDRVVKSGPATDPQALEKLDAKIKKYEKEKEEIKGKAEAFEKKRDEARDAATHSSHQGSSIGLAVSIFSIAIAIGSITLVVKKKPLWFISLAFGAGAAIQTILAIWFTQ